MAPYTVNVASLFKHLVKSESPTDDQGIISLHQPTDVFLKVTSPRINFITGIIIIAIRMWKSIAP
jgi:hypothetical protein